MTNSVRNKKTGTIMRFPDERHYFQKIFFESIDYVVNSTQARFDQPDFKMYIPLQNLFSKPIIRNITSKS